MNTRIYAHAADLKGFSVKNCPSMPPPSGELMCAPDFYDISAIRNPYMAAGIGRVDKATARQQWDGVRAAFETLGKPVRLIDPAPGFEDMVFASAQTFTGLTTRMERVCMLSQMCHPARQGEVPHFERWFRQEGYQIVRLKDAAFRFEGMGDCLWHPGKRLLWGAYGFRSDAEVYEQVAQAFETPVVLLKLVNERFFYLDTCFCPLTPEAVLIYPPAFDPDSLELILRMFPIVLAADEREVSSKLPCCASVVDSTAVIQKGAATASRHIQAIGMKILEVDTSEFLKSGASVCGLRMHLY